MTMKSTNTKSYSELVKFDTFEERFRYLMLKGNVGEETFGTRRYLNQMLYHSLKWRRFRDQIIIRDNGCDLGVEGYEFSKDEPVFLHHINPITHEDIVNMNYCLFDPENVICTKFFTHNAIHYGDDSFLNNLFVERMPNDTCPWRNIRRD